MKFLCELKAVLETDLPEDFSIFKLEDSDFRALATEFLNAHFKEGIFIVTIKPVIVEGKDGIVYGQAKSVTCSIGVDDTDVLESVPPIKIIQANIV